MKKTNIFHVKKIKDQQITVEEERKKHSAFILFFLRNGRLLFVISMILSFTIFLIAFDLAISNLNESKVVEHESNGVVVSFVDSNSEDSFIINGTPITNEYANKIFESETISSNNAGVVLRLKETSFVGGKVSFYSDKTALIKYDDGRYLRVFPINNTYGVNENGVINQKTITRVVRGEKKRNNSLNIELLYLSDGTIEITKDDTVLFVRNTDITSLDNLFYTNMSGVAVIIKKEKNLIYYSDGSVKENTSLVVDGKTYLKREEKKIFNNITIIYYENGYAEIIYENLQILVAEEEDIIYSNDTLEIINSKKEEQVDMDNIMSIKNINLKNTNDTISHYMIVLEETDNYDQYNITKRLDSKYINFNVLVNSDKINNQILNNNIKDDNKLENNTYLLYEGDLAPNEEAKIKLGLWISYENITNEYMNSAFIGTLKVYVESLS